MFYDFVMPKTPKEPTLDILFDSPVRTRILKLFLYGFDRSFDAKNISRKLQINPRILKRELQRLSDIGFIKSRGVARKKVFTVNQSFGFYEPLRSLLTKTLPVSRESMLGRILRLGKIKLALISGVFINADNSRADLMIVGDDINQARLNRFFRNLEAEVGKDLNYAVMTTKEFNYRFGMYDKFVRDLLEFKHEKLINKLRI